jgi:hypothetical protein
MSLGVLLYQAVPYITLPRGTRTAKMTKATKKPELPPAAQRALAEAEDRRNKAQPPNPPTELGGRDGLDPVRYGDWEKKGLAVDF